MGGTKAPIHKTTQDFCYKPQPLFNTSPVLDTSRVLNTRRVLSTRQVLDTGQVLVFCMYQGALRSGPNFSCGSCGSCASHSGIPGRFYIPARLGIAKRLRCRVSVVVKE